MLRHTRRGIVALLTLASLVVPAGARASGPPGATNCPVFPANNVWHADISHLPVHARSAAWITSMGGATQLLHPDFGPSGEAMPYGIPYIVVPGSHAKVSVDFTYAGESDVGPYPLGSDTPIESGSDAHALMIDKDTCTLYEIYNTVYSPSGSTGGSGAIFDLRSNVLRPQTWTSADAAGLPIFSGLLRQDEVASGVVDHAIRVTAARTDERYIWPARHQAGAAADQNLPPMGARFRLRSGYAIGSFRPDTQVILRAMKRYGLLLADNGSNWFFGGAAEDGWNTDMLDELKSVPAGAFDAIDESSLMVDPNSGAVRSSQPPVLTATLRPPVIPLGSTASLSGSVSPDHSGQPVLLQRLLAGAWRTEQTAALSRTSTFTFQIRPPQSGRFTYRVRKPPDADHPGVTGEPMTLTVFATTLRAIRFDAPGNDATNLNGEYAVIVNTGRVTVNLARWRLRADAIGFTLAAYRLAPRASVKVRTGAGGTSAGVTHLGARSPIWSNSGGVGRLYDPHGRRVSVLRYAV